MRWRRYEPKFKVTVPINPPKYIEEGINCYLEKMKEKGAVGFICPEILSQKCALCWLCMELALLTLTARRIVLWGKA